jgi:maleamate amidohydrolase
VSERTGSTVGSDDLRLPEELRGPVGEHLDELRRRYAQRGWGGRVGFGERPALLVIDLALFWTRPDTPMGSHVDPVVEAACQVLKAARAALIPVFFSTYDYEPAEPPSPHDRKLRLGLQPGDEGLLQLDPRLGRLPTEKVIRKKYASCFKATNLHEMLTALRVDTLIVTGLSTSHCVYATCRDGTDSFRVIVPAEAVGDRCELFHRVNLLDIDLDLGDVLPVGEVITYLTDCGAKNPG